MSRLAPLDGDLDESPKDLRRSQILDAARICFARAGFHGASMQQICSEARMSPGALYRYFPSKEAIIEAIAEEERLKATGVMAVFQEPGSIVDRLMRAAESYFALMRRPGGSELMVEICSESLRNTTVGHRFHCIETDVRGLFFDALARAQATGEIDPSVDIQSAVTMLLAMGDGLVMRFSLDPDVSVDSLLPTLRRAVEGMLPPPGIRTA